jgi:hypothetical protein
MADKEKIVIKIDPSVVQDNPHVRTIVRRDGHIQTFNSRQEAERWIESLEKMGKKKLELEETANMTSRQPDKRLVEKRDQDSNRYL